MQPDRGQGIGPAMHASVHIPSHTDTRADSRMYTYASSGSPFAAMGCAWAPAAVLREILVFHWLCVAATQPFLGRLPPGNPRTITPQDTASAAHFRAIIAACTTTDRILTLSPADLGRTRKHACHWTTFLLRSECLDGFKLGGTQGWIEAEEDTYPDGEGEGDAHSQPRDHGRPVSERRGSNGEANTSCDTCQSPHPGEHG